MTITRKIMVMISAVALPLSASLGADTAAQKADQQASQTSARYTSYCQKRFLKAEKGLLKCNWGSSFSEACAISFPIKELQQGAVVSGPSSSGQCNDRNEVVVINHN